MCRQRLDTGSGSGHLLLELLLLKLLLQLLLLELLLLLLLQALLLLLLLRRLVLLLLLQLLLVPQLLLHLVRRLQEGGRRAAPLPVTAARLLLQRQRRRASSPRGALLLLLLLEQPEQVVGALLQNTFPDVKDDLLLTSCTETHITAPTLRAAARMVTRHARPAASSVQPRLRAVTWGWGWDSAGGRPLAPMAPRPCSS